MRSFRERKPNHLQSYDYSQNGFYFVTICTKNREHYFGEIKNGEMVLNEYGEIVKNQWLWLANQYEYVQLGEYIVMPNHAHGILILDDGCCNNGRDRLRPVPTTYAQCAYAGNMKSVSQLIGAFKTTSSKMIHQNGLSDFAWQRSFYDHIIRDERSLCNIQQYIQNNPKNWELEKDRNHMLDYKHPF